MPIFEYRCEACGRRFEEIVLGKEPSSMPCPGCSSEDTHKLMSTFCWSGSDGSHAASSCSSCSSAGHSCKSCSSR